MRLALAYLVHRVNGFVEVAEIWRTVRIHLDTCLVKEQHQQRGKEGGESRRAEGYIRSHEQARYARLPPFYPLDCPSAPLSRLCLPDS